MYRVYRQDKLGNEFEAEFSTEREAEEYAADAMLNEQYDYASEAEWRRNRSYWEVRIEFAEEEV
jgi:hypothetical protein